MSQVPEGLSRPVRPSGSHGVGTGTGRAAAAKGTAGTAGQGPALQLAEAMKREGDFKSTLQFHVRSYWLPIAERLVAQGWRPPVQVIETVEELDALQPRSDILEYWENCHGRPEAVVVRDAKGFTFERDTERGNIDFEERCVHALWWEMGTDRDDVDSTKLNLPVTVLWSPPEKAVTE